MKLTNVLAVPPCFGVSLRFCTVEFCEALGILVLLHTYCIEYSCNAPNLEQPQCDAGKITPVKLSPLQSKALQQCKHFGISLSRSLAPSLSLSLLQATLNIDTTGMCMYIGIYTYDLYMHIHLYTSMHINMIYIHAYMHIHMFTYLHTYTSTYTYRCTHTCTYVHI